MQTNKGQFKKGDKLVRGKPFKAGHEPFNKGRAWTEYMSPEGKNRALETTFKTGNIPPTLLPKGTVKKRFHSRYKTWHNIINIDPLTGERRPNYSYAKFVLEQYLGRYLDKSEIVYHIDRDSGNDNINNLEIITRQELGKRIKNYV